VTESLGLTQPGPPPEPEGEAELQAAELAELVQQLVKSVRAHQIYDVQNPVYQRFVANLRDALTRLWQRVPSVHFGVTDHALVWQGHELDAGEAKENLAFLFYKDGIRGVSLLQGFEDEVERFLDVIHRARHSPRESEDLLTLLWDADFDAFRYDFVDQLAQGLEIPEGGEGLTAGIPAELLSVELRGGAEEGGETEPGNVISSSAAAPPAPMEGIVRMTDFQETLYFLDESELRVLEREVELEMGREVKRDVVNALFDRVEDGVPERQREILDILAQLLPSLLIRGDMKNASHILVELDRALAEPSSLPTDLQVRAREIFDELSRSESVEQLVRALEDGVLEPNAQELGVFFMHLRPTALPMLLAAARRSTRTGLRARLQAGADAIARGHPDAALELLGDPDPEVAAGAAGVAARLKLEQAAPGLAQLLHRPEPATRLAAVDAALALHTGATMNIAVSALGDEDREVRMHAARGLASYRYAPARERLEETIRGPISRSSDRTERVLFFEAFAQVGGVDAVPYLDSVLNGRSRLGLRQSPELRACAARALGLIQARVAREALKQSASDKDVVVRNEVSRALRQEASAG